ncbi:MAG: hypothetical protein KDC49_23015 [Saprospiraceae bacterium]|nr:hypothetical protein [Saprospiraceae bacterium]
MANKSFTPSAPNQIVWIIGLIAGILGILGNYTDIDVLAQYNYEMLLIGFILLAAGTTFRNV